MRGARTFSATASCSGTTEADQFFMPMNLPDAVDERVELGVGLLARHSRLEVTDDAEAMGHAGHGAEVGIGPGYEDSRGNGRPEGGRQDADDRIGQSVGGDLAADDAPVPAEEAVPMLVAHDGDPVVEAFRWGGSRGRGLV